MLNQNNNQQLIKLENGKCKITGTCVLTGKQYTTQEFPLDAYEAYKSGAMIQNALYMLSVDDREFILSSISPVGWEQMKFEEETEEQYNQYSKF